MTDRTRQTRPAPACRLTGYPMVLVRETWSVYVVHVDDRPPFELTAGTTLAQAQECARLIKRIYTPTTMRLAKEWRSSTFAEYAHPEHAEMYGDRLAAGEFDHLRNAG